MKFLWNALARLPEYQTLEDAVSTGALPAAATGLSGIHKAAVSGALCARQGRKARSLRRMKLRRSALLATLPRLTAPAGPPGLGLQPAGRGERLPRI
ncbi:MAG: hypothetical protein ACLSB9_17220 [Hydrogeniiclostridium mannosilyticum]